MAFEDLLVQLTSKLDESGFKALDKMEDRAMKKTSILSNSLKRMFVGVLGTFAVKSIMDATVKLDTLQRSMTALAGSEIGGKSQLSYLRQEADRLGQSFVTITDSYKNLFAAGKGAGWSPDDIQQVFSSVLEAGTVLGSSKQQIGGALLSVEQMISKGRVSMEELRRQLGNALPGAMQVAAKAMGVTSEQLQDMISKGIASEDFVKKFAATLHEEYGQKATESAHTLRAELERLGNAIFFLQTALLDGDNMQGVAEAIREITRLISSPVFLKGINEIGKLVAFLAKNLKLILGIAVIIGLRRIWQTLVILRLELLTTTFAAGSLGAAMQMIVAGNVIAGLRTITGIFLAWLAPLLKVAAILAIIVELVDTLRGKPTATGEFFEHMPTLREFAASEKFQRGWIDFKKKMPWYKEAPMLWDPSNPAAPEEIKKMGRMSSNNATVIINANSADGQQVANLVKTTISDMFNSYEEVYT